MMRPALSSLWELRNSGKIAECRSGLVAWGASRGLSAELPLSTRITRLLESALPEDDAVSYALVEISLHRNRLDFAKAESELTALEERFPRASEASRHLILFQRGLNAFASGNYLGALDLFIEADHYTKDPLQKAWVGHNQLLALDELGWDHSEMLETFRLALEDLAPEWKKYFEEKITSLVLRKGFRSGNWGEVSLGRLDGHSRYLLHWLASIPYLTLPIPTVAGTALDRHWLSGFRLRTLSGLLLEEDLRSDLPLRERVERFYLWTWSWLLDPRADSLERILELRRHLLPGGRASLSPEHGQMLENALRWLGLFAYLPEAELRQALAGFSRANGPGSILLEYEKYLLDYFHAVRGRSLTVAVDTLTFLGGHPAHALAGFHLPLLLQSALPPRLSSLWIGLRELLPKQEAPLEQGIVVHALEKKIRRIAKGACVEEIPQLGLVSLCLLAKEKPTFTKAEILRYAFGLPRYDAYSHDPKLANLLSLANGKLKGVLRFTVKGDLISVKLLAPEKLRFEGECRHTRLLASTFQDPGLLLGEVAAKEIEIPIDWISRNHFEKSLKVSKATATRRLRAWVTEGILESRGQGKSSKYRVTPKLAQRLRQEGVQL